MNYMFFKKKKNLKLFWKVCLSLGGALLLCPFVMRQIQPTRLSTRHGKLCPLFLKPRRRPERDTRRGKRNTLGVHFRPVGTHCLPPSMLLAVHTKITETTPLPLSNLARQLSFAFLLCKRFNALVHTFFFFNTKCIKIVHNS